MTYASPRVDIYGRTITMYVGNIPLNGDETVAYQTLLQKLPPDPTCGIQIKKWFDYYPTAPFFGIMIGLRDMTVAQSIEVLVPYADFNMEAVPWDKLNRVKECV